MMPIAELICPHCHEKLDLLERALRCRNGHSFDLAREGYVNLLPGKRPVGPAAGDTAEMVKARREFLNDGHYRPLAEALAAAVIEGLPSKGGVVADVGCGEGYYLRVLLEMPEARGVRAYGTDISKPAIAAAAKASGRAQFVVADTNTLIPLADASVDVLVNVFAPRNAVEFARVVRPGGRVVVAIPRPEHLAAVRERFGLLGIESDKPAKIAAQLADFDLKSSREVSLGLRLDGPALRNLLQMTPNNWHFDEARRAELEMADTTVAEAAFELLVFIRRD